jgi:hypothetical protein
MTFYCLKLLVAISLFVIQTQCKEKHPIKDLGYNLHNYAIALDSPNLNKGHSEDPNISDDETIPVKADYPTKSSETFSYWDNSNENSESKEVNKH